MVQLEFCKDVFVCVVEPMIGFQSLCQSSEKHERGTYELMLESQLKQAEAACIVYSLEFRNKAMSMLSLLRENYL